MKHYFPRNGDVSVSQVTVCSETAGGYLQGVLCCKVNFVHRDTVNCIAFITNVYVHFVREGLFWGIE